MQLGAKSLKLELEKSRQKESGAEQRIEELEAITVRVRVRVRGKNSGINGPRLSSPVLASRPWRLGGRF